LDILDALLSSYTSLFKITSVSRREKLVFFNDILNRRGHIGLIDIALSKTATVRMLLFFRFLSFSDFNMASGVSFAFPGELEGYLLGKYERLSKKVESDSDSIKRFVSFFGLSKTDGLDFTYNMAKEQGQEPWGPIKEKVERGELGMKSGKGFYDWLGDTAKQFLRKYNLELIRLWPNLRYDNPDGSDFPFFQNRDIITPCEGRRQCSQSNPVIRG